MAKKQQGRRRPGRPRAITPDVQARICAVLRACGTIDEVDELRHRYAELLERACVVAFLASAYERP